MKYELILARSLDGTIGLADGKLPFKQKSDMKFFKEMTAGHITVFGRTTWETFRNRLLPDRTMVVLTSDPKAAREAYTSQTDTPQLDRIDFTDKLNKGTDFSWVCKEHLLDLSGEVPEGVESDPNEEQNCDTKVVMICGGAQLYAYALANLNVTKVHLTEVEAEFYETDNVRFTHDFEADPRFAMTYCSATIPADENNEHSFRFKTYVPKRLL